MVSPSNRWVPVGLLIVGLLLSGSALFAMWTHRLPLEIPLGAKALSDHHPEEARKSFEAALQADHRNPAFYTAIYAAIQHEQNWEMAVDFARRGVNECATDPKVLPATRAQLYANLAEALSNWKSANWKMETLETAQLAYETDPKNPAAMNLYGEMLTDLDGSPGALLRAENLTRNALGDLSARVASPDVVIQRALAQAHYGWIRYKRGYAADAVSEITEAISTLPTDYDNATTLAKLHGCLGLAYQKLGQTTGAKHSFEAALQYNPKDLVAREALKTLPSVESAKPPVKSDSSL